MKSAFLSTTVCRFSLIALMLASMFCSASFAAGTQLDDLLDRVEKIQSQNEQDAQSLRQVDQDVMSETEYVQRLGVKLESGASQERIASELANVERKVEEMFGRFKRVEQSIEGSAEALARIEVQTSQRRSRELSFAIKQTKDQISALYRDIDVVSDDFQTLNEDIDTLWKKLAQSN